MIGSFVQATFFLSRMGFGHPNTVIHVTFMWNHVKIQNCFLHTLSDSVNSRNTCEVDWIDIRSYECFSDASRDYKSGEIHVNSCEIMWKSITGFLELTTFWYGLCGLQDHLRSTLHPYSKLRMILRCLPRLQISWNSYEIMWKSQSGFLELTTNWYGLCVPGSLVK